MTIFTRLWDTAGYEASPPDTQDVSQGADRIRELKKDIRERLDIDHIMDEGAAADSDDGRHRQVYMPSRLTNLAKVTENSIVYHPLFIFDNASDTDLQLRWVDGDGIVITLIKDGVINIINTANTWLRAQRSTLITLTDAATIAINANDSNIYEVTLGANRTLGNPSNLGANWTATIVINQDGTGGRTLAYHANYKFPEGVTPEVAAGANDVSVLSVTYEGNILMASMLPNFS